MNLYLIFYSVNRIPKSVNKYPVNKLLTVNKICESIPNLMLIKSFIELIKIFRNYRVNVIKFGYSYL